MGNPAHRALADLHDLRQATADGFRSGACRNAGIRGFVVRVAEGAGQQGGDLLPAGGGRVELAAHFGVSVGPDQDVITEPADVTIDS